MSEASIMIEASTRKTTAYEGMRRGIVIC